MKTWINVPRATVKQIVDATFPEYRGRKIRVAASTTVSLSDLNWSGGTRSVYRACSLAGEQAGSSAKWNAMAPWDNPAEGVELPVPQGFVCVEHSHFCGKDSGLRIYVNPADMPKLIENANG